MNEVKAYDPRSFVLVETARNGISDHLSQPVEVIRLGDDRLAQYSPRGTSDVAALRCLFDHEYELESNNCATLPPRQPQSALAGTRHNLALVGLGSYTTTTDHVPALVVGHGTPPDAMWS